MTQRKHEAPTPLPSPHAEVAQEILGGVPLLRPAETYKISATRGAAGEVVLDYIGQMIQHHTGVNLGRQSKPRGLTQTDINELSNLPDAKYLARELRIANNFGTNMPNIVLPAIADKPTTPRSKLQATLLDEIATHYQSLPKGLIYMPDHPLVKRFWDAYLAIGKTGVGKTAVEALSCFLAGVTADRNTTIDAKVATSTQSLVREYAGRLGTSTFLEFLGKKIPISIFYEFEHDTSGHVVIGSIASAKEFITGKEDFLVIDEGHNLLGKKTMAWLGSLEVRRPLIATATPSYSLKETPHSPNELPRDLRHFCTSSSTKSNADLMEDGILNPTRIREILYDDDPIPLACELAIQHLRAGDRVGIYCEPGKDQPEKIAQLINTMIGKKVVDWIASVRRDSLKIEQAIIQGGLQGFTTCKKLGEGSNIPGLHKAIFVNPGSPLALEQHAGRFWRPGKTITELYHLIKRGAKPGPRLAKIIGVESADPDRIIGYTSADTELDGASPNVSSRPKGSNGGNIFPHGLPTEELPPLALAGLIRARKQVLVTPEKQTPTEGYIRLSGLAASKDLPALWLRMVFDRANITHEVILTEQEDGTSDYERWYAPELDEWLEQHPLDELAANTTMTVEEMAEMCETTEEHIISILHELGIEHDTEQAENQSARPFAHDFAVIRSVSHEIAAIKTAAPGDMPIGEAYREFGSELASFAIAHPDIPCNMQDLRRNPLHGVRGITGHVREDGVALLRAARERLDAIPYSTPLKYRTLTAMARQAGSDIAALRERINIDEAKTIKIMRMGNRSLPAEFVSGKDAEAILRRLRPKPLPSSLIPPTVYKAYFGEDNSIRALDWLNGQGQELIPFPVKGAPHDTPCMTWSQFEAADAEFGRANWMQEVDFNKVRGVSAKNPGAAPDAQKAMAYRRGVLQRFITDDALLLKQDEDTMDVPVVIPRAEMEPFNIAAVLFPEVFTEPGANAKEPTPTTPMQETSAPTPRAAKPKPMAAVERPEHIPKPEPKPGPAQVRVEPEPAPVEPEPTVAAPRPIISPVFQGIPIPEIPTTTEPAVMPESEVEPQPSTSGPVIPPVIFMGPAQSATPESEPAPEEPASQPEPLPEPKPEPTPAPKAEKIEVAKPKTAPKATKAAPPQSNAVEPDDAAEGAVDVEADFAEILQEVETTEAPDTSTEAPEVEDDETEPDGGFEVPVTGQWATPKRTEVPVPKPVQKPAPKKPVAWQQAKTPKRPPHGFSADSVDIDIELLPYCSPLALAFLIKEQQVQVRRDNAKVRWAERDDVELLKLAIEEIEVAPSHFKTAGMIAENFKRRIPGITERNIIGVAVQLASDLSACTRPYRTRGEGGRPGKLDMYFSGPFSDRLTEVIEQLIRTRHVRDILTGARLPI